MTINIQPVRTVLSMGGGVLYVVRQTTPYLTTGNKPMASYVIELPKTAIEADEIPLLAELLFAAKRFIEEQTS